MVKGTRHVQISNATSKKDLGFSWKGYTDPKSKDFWTEGSFVTPKPIQFLAQNPTDENIKKWLEVVNKKNKLQARLVSKVQDYIRRRKGNQATRAYLKTSVNRNLLNQKEDWKRYRFRLYVDSACPHCKRMLDTMVRLQRDGYYVEIHQIDRGAWPKGTPIPVILADRKDVRKKGITTVPYLMVADVEKGVLYPMKGYQTKQGVLAHLRRL